jgi:thiamine kinase-like enzyme
MLLIDSDPIHEVRLSQIISAFAKEQRFFHVPNYLKMIPLIGGKSQATLYRFEMNQHHYVLRLLPPSSKTTHEIQIAKQAGQIGIAPVVHFADPQLGALIMDFIHGRTVHPLDFTNQVLIVSFAQRLRQLHQATDHFPFAQSPFQRFHQFLIKGEEQKVTYPPRMEKAKKSLEEIETVLQLHPVALTPTHLDLNPLNILLANENFFLIDWVNGGLSDPYFDLATFCIFHGLSVEQTKIFLTHYFGREPMPLGVEQVCYCAAGALIRNCSGLFLSILSEVDIHVEALWLNDFITQHAEGKADLPLRQIGVTMLKAGLDLVEGSDFKQALCVLKGLQ